MKKRFRHLLRTPRTWVVLLLAAWALGAPADIFRQLPATSSAIASFIAIFVAPGLIFAVTVLSRREADILEYLAYAYSFSLGILALPSVALLAFNLSFQTYDRMFAAVIAALVAVYVIRGMLRIEISPSSTPTLQRSGILALQLLLVAAAIVIVPLATESTLDGDTFTYLAYIQELQDTSNMNQHEALFGTDVEVSPRARFNIWVTLPGYLVHVSRNNSVTMAADYLPPMLALLSLAAFYTLALALTRERDFATFATLIHGIIVLAAPFHRATNPGSMTLQRIVADKFMVLLLILPVQTALTVRWLTAGRRRDLGLIALVTLASSLIHPLIAAFYAIVVVAFGGLYALSRLRDARTWRRLVGAVLIALIGLGLPFFLRQEATATQGQYLFPNDFEEWPLVQRPTPVFPFVQVPSWNLRDAGPEIREVQPEDATSDEGVSPFLLWRFRTNMRARRLLLFAPDVYTAHPDLMLEIPIVLAMLLSPLLLFRLRFPLAQYLLGVTLAVLVMLYNPLITPLVGRLITPWMVWRLTWLLPVSLILAYFAFGMVRLGQRLLFRGGAWLRWPASLLPAVMVIGITLLSSSYIQSHVETLERHLRQPNDDDVETVQMLAQALSGAEATVLAQRDLNVLIPAYIGKANVVGHRVNTTSEHFPQDRQDEALRRIQDVEDFFAPDSLVSHSLAILERYDVRYVVADASSDLAAQLRNMDPYFQLVSQNRRHALFRVDATPPWEGIVAGFDAVAGERWEDARVAFERAAAEDENDPLAWAGLGAALEGAGDPQAATVAYQRAIELAPEDPWFHIQLAETYESLAQVDLAIDEYEEARSLAPQNTSVELTLADLYRIQEREGSNASVAFALATARKSSGSNDAEFFSQIGDLWFERELFGQAAEAYEKAVEHSPTHWHVPRLSQAFQVATLDPSISRALRLSQAYHADGQLEQALNAVRKALTRSPWSPVLYRQIGAIYGELGQNQTAIQAYERAVWMAELLMDPQVDPYVELGNLYVEVGDLEKAESVFWEAAALDPHAASPYIGLGALFETSRRPDDAEAAYRAAIDVEPSNVLSYINLGRLYLDQGQIDEALQQYQAAVRARPQEEIAYILLGEAYRQAGQLDAAVDAFRQALDLSPRNVLGHIGLVRTYIAQARLDQARGQAQIAVRVAPGSARAHIALGDVHRILGETEVALTDYRAAVEAEPDFAGSYMALGQAYQAMGRLEEALNKYQQAQQLETQSAQIQIALGDAYASLASNSAPGPAAASLGASQDSVVADSGEADTRAFGEPDQLLTQAIHAYQVAIRSQQQYIPSYAALTRLQLTLGQRQEAIAQGSAAVEANPRSPDAHLVLGQTLLAVGEHASALDAYKTASKLAPYDVSVAVAVGRAYQSLGQTPEALSQFRSAVEANPTAIAGYLALADALVAYGDVEEALEAYSTAVQLQPGSIAAHLGRGRALRVLGRYRDALEAAEDGISVRPGDPSGYLAKGRALEQMDQFDEARAAYERAAQLNRAAPAPHLALGDLWLTRGKTGEALAAYRAAIDAAPGNPQSWLAMANALRTADQSDEAITAYRTAADLDKNLADPWVGLGELYASEGQTEQAAIAFRQAMDRVTGDPRAFLGLVLGIGQLYDSQNQAELASDRTQPGSAQAHVALGDFLLRRGDPAEAVDAYRQALHQAPQVRSAARPLVQAFAERGDWLSAASTLQHHFAVAPGDVAPYLTLAALQSLRGETYAARQTVGRAVAGHASLIPGLEEPTGTDLQVEGPTDARGYLRLGQLRETEGRIAEAQQAYEAIISLDDSSSEALDARLRLAHIAESQDNLRRAEALYEAAVERDPTAPIAYLALGGFLEDQGRLVDAAAAFVRAVKLERGQAAPWVTLGNLKAAQGNQAAARTAYEMAKWAEPDDPIYHLQLSQEHLAQGHTEAALTEFRAAAKQEPRSILLQTAIGDLYRNLGDYESALRAYRPAIETFNRAADAEPQSLSAFLSIIQNQQDSSQSWKATRWYARARARVPTAVESYLALGDLLRDREENALAEDAYRQALQVDSSAFGAHLALAQLHLDQEEQEKAETAFEQALIASNGQAGHAGLMRIYHQEGEEEDALERYQNLAEENPNAAWVQMAVAKTHDALEHIDEAIAAYEHVVSLDPNNADAHQRLAQLSEDRADGRARAMQAWETFKKLTSSAEAIAEANERLRILRQVWITAPEVGSQVSGEVEIRGNADDEAFKSYEMKVGTGDGEWTTIESGTEPVQADLLARWDTEGVEPGTYQIQLVVTNTDNEELPYAQISVVVEK